MQPLPQTRRVYPSPGSLTSTSIAATAGVSTSLTISDTATTKTSPNTDTASTATHSAPPITHHQAARRHDDILRLPPEARCTPLLQLLAELDQLDGPDKVCMHNEIAIATLALPAADAEALHAPLMTMLERAHQELSLDAQEDVATGFAEILLMSGAPRDANFHVRLAGRLIHLANHMKADRLVSRCLEEIERSLDTRNEARRAELIGNAAPVVPALSRKSRLAYLQMLHDALPKDPAYRLAAITALANQLELLPVNQDTMDFYRSVINERCALRLAAAELEMTVNKLAEVRIASNTSPSQV